LAHASKVAIATELFSTLRCHRGVAGDVTFRVEDVIHHSLPSLGRKCKACGSNRAAAENYSRCAVPKVWFGSTSAVQANSKAIGVHLM